MERPPVEEYANTMYLYAETQRIVGELTEWIETLESQLASAKEEGERVREAINNIRGYLCEITRRLEEVNSDWIHKVIKQVLKEDENDRN